MAPFASIFHHGLRFMAVAMATSNNDSTANVASGGNQYVHAAESSDRQELLHLCFRGTSRDAFVMSGIVEASTRKGKIDAPFRVLEIGCGAGHTTLDLLDDILPDHCSITSVDADPNMIATAQSRLSSIHARKGRISFLHQNGESLPQTMAGQFDAVWLRFVVVHVPDPAALLQAAVDCLKPGGTLLVEDIYVPGTTSLCDPPVYAHSFFHEMHTKASLRLGGDLTRGAKVGQHMQSMGLQNIQCNTFAPIFGNGVDVLPWTAGYFKSTSGVGNSDATIDRFELGWNLFEKSLVSLIPKLRELQICSEEEIARAEESLKDYRQELESKSQRMQVFALPDGTVFQWWATKAAQ